MLTETTKTAKNKARERIERDTQAFLKRGGRIKRFGVICRDTQEKLSFKEKRKRLFEFVSGRPTGGTDGRR